MRILVVVGVLVAATRWFCWAWVMIDAIDRLAESVAMDLKWTAYEDDRWLAELGRARWEVAGWLALAAGARPVPGLRSRPH